MAATDGCLSATVESCDFRTNASFPSATVGYYDVVYSYKIDDERFIGRFSDFGAADDDYFHRGETIEIRYDPKTRQRSYYPLLRTQTNYRLICAATGAVLGVVVLIISWLSHR